MEELSGRGSRRPSGGADERKEKVAAEGVVQKGGCGRDRWGGESGKREEIFEKGEEVAL